MTALIKSMREAVLFDRRYWARPSVTGNILRPLYMSSTIAGETSQPLDSLVGLHREGECFEASEESEDSDWESSGSRPDGQIDKKDETQQELLPLLTVGPFASWSSLFFYMCTNAIQFAPLTSLGAGARTQYIQDWTTLKNPPPCSPKTIYSLATVLGMKALRGLAYHEMRSKITSANIIPELFSTFTSRHADIAEMQCALLYDKFNDESTTDEGMALIKGIVGGGSAHSAHVFKQALKEGLFNSVFPRCARKECKFHNNNTCGLLKSSLDCPLHYCFGRMVCSECRARPGRLGQKSCDDCGKRFR